MSFVAENKEEYLISSSGLIEIIEAVTSRQNSVRLRVKGFSMFPFIRDNDVVTISPLTNNSIGFGLPEVYINPWNNNIAIHRAVGKCRCGSHYIIKGDNLSDVDGLIEKKNILGFVAKVERERRNIVLGLGPERRIVAYLSRIGLLLLLMRGLAFLFRPLRRIFYG